MTRRGAWATLPVVIASGLLVLPPLSGSAGADPVDAVSVRLVPGSTAVVPRGGTGSISAVLHNDGGATATNVAAALALPSGLTATAAQVPGGSCTLAPVVCTVPALGVGQAATVSVSLSAPVNAPLGSSPAAWSLSASNSYLAGSGQFLSRRWAVAAGGAGCSEGGSLESSWPLSATNPDQFTCAGAPLGSGTAPVAESVVTTSIPDSGPGDASMEVRGVLVHRGTTARTVRVCMRGTDDAGGVWSKRLAAGTPWTDIDPGTAPDATQDSWQGGGAELRSNAHTLQPGDALAFVVRQSNRNGAGGADMLRVMTDGQSCPAASSETLHNFSNGSWTQPVSVIAVAPDLTITSMVAPELQRGQTGWLQATVRNLSAAVSAHGATLEWTLPVGLMVDRSRALPAGCTAADSGDSSTVQCSLVAGDGDLDQSGTFDPGEARLVDLPVVAAISGPFSGGSVSVDSALGNRNGNVRITGYGPSSVRAAEPSRLDRPA